MKKVTIIAAILVIFYSVSLEATSLEVNARLGFGGLYKENSWTPLLVRIGNNDRTINGLLIVEIVNSTTKNDEKRKYIKPLQLGTGDSKEFNFVLPMGYRSKKLTVIIESEESVIYNELIEVRQNKVESRFILSLSPFPDLGYVQNYKEVKDLIITYPHINNLPENHSAYESVEIFSIHRELMDKLSIKQFDAINSWVSLGGNLVVWGGKNPSPSKWNYLPSTVSGLFRIPNLSIFDLTLENLLINQFKDSETEALLKVDDYDLITYKRDGKGYVYFVAFDYNNIPLKWKGLERIWNVFFQSSSKVYDHQYREKLPYSNEKAKALYENSDFSFRPRKNVALLLFLSASTALSILLLLKFRRGSKNIYKYSAFATLFLLAFSSILYFTLFNKKVRTECAAISLSVYKQFNNSDKGFVSHDLLLGSLSETSSHMKLLWDSKSILIEKENENLTVLESPQIEIRNLSMNAWNFKVLRFKRSISNLLTVNIKKDLIQINNISDFYMEDCFVLYNNKYMNCGNLMSRSSKIIHINQLKEITYDQLDFNDKPLLKEFVGEFLEFDKESSSLKFVAQINNSLSPLDFSNITWRTKQANIIYLEIDEKEITLEKPNL